MPHQFIALYDPGVLWHGQYSGGTIGRTTIAVDGGIRGFGQVACALNNDGTLQVCAIDGLRSSLLHAIWDPAKPTVFSNVQLETDRVGPDRGPLQYVACATGADNELHVCAIDQRNGLWHTIRAPNGNWPYQLSDVQAETRKIGPNSGIGPTPRVACAVDRRNGDLHILALDQNDGLWHTIRQTVRRRRPTTTVLEVLDANGLPIGIWPYPFQDVQQAVRNNNGGNSGLESPTRRIACCTSPNGDLHVGVVDHNGNFAYTIRNANEGSWK